MKLLQVFCLLLFVFSDGQDAQHVIGKEEDAVKVEEAAGGEAPPLGPPRPLGDTRQDGSGGVRFEASTPTQVEDGKAQGNFVEAGVEAFGDVGLATAGEENDLRRGSSSPTVSDEDVAVVDVGVGMDDNVDDDVDEDEDDADSNAGSMAAAAAVLESLNESLTEAQVGTINSPVTNERGETEGEVETEAEEERETMVEVEAAAASLPSSEAEPVLIPEAEAEAEALAEKERLEAEALAEKEKLAEKERLETEALAEKERLEAEALAEKERVEAEALGDKERLEAEALAEKEKLAEKERLEAEALAEKERLEAGAAAERLAELQRLEVQLQAAKLGREWEESKTAFNGDRGGGTDLGAGGIADMMQRMEQLERRAMDVLDDIREQEDEEKSLLEVFGERVKTFVVTKVTPKTDKECHFSWTRGRCEPKCTCQFDMKLGDYWPDRACRVIPPRLVDESCTSSTPFPSDTPVAVRVSSTIWRYVRLGANEYDRRIAPPTDKECHFDMRKMRCEPRGRCSLQFKWGDVTPGRVCRLKAEGDGGE
ncbi:unnamed protein product [Chrysoparadoxa australica]